MMEAGPQPSPSHLLAGIYPASLTLRRHQVRVVGKSTLLCKISASDIAWRTVLHPSRLRPCMGSRRASHHPPRNRLWACCQRQESREDRPCLASIMIRAKSWTNHPGLIIASYVTACSSTVAATAGPLRLSCLARPAACNPSLRRTKLSLAVTALAWHRIGMHGRLTSKTAAFLRAYRQ